LEGRSFFPHLISAPFASGLAEAFTFAVVACLIAALASWLRGSKYHHESPVEREMHTGESDERVGGDADRSSITAEDHEGTSDELGAANTMRPQASIGSPPR
jgi:hypothetical protein